MGKSLVGPDGAWRPSLLYPGVYPHGETTATGAFTYGLAYGISAGLLPAEDYLSVVREAGNGCPQWRCRQTAQSGIASLSLEVRTGTTAQAPRTRMEWASFCWPPRRWRASARDVSVYNISPIVK